MSLTDSLAAFARLCATRDRQLADRVASLQARVNALDPNSDTYGEEVSSLSLEFMQLQLAAHTSQFLGLDSVRSSLDTLADTASGSHSGYISSSTIYFFPTSTRSSTSNLTISSSQASNITHTSLSLLKENPFIRVNLSIVMPLEKHVTTYAGYMPEQSTSGTVLTATDTATLVNTTPPAGGACNLTITDLLTGEELFRKVCNTGNTDFEFHPPFTTDAHLLIEIRGAVVRTPVVRYYIIVDATETLATSSVYGPLRLDKFFASPWRRSAVNPVLGVIGQHLAHNLAGVKLGQSYTAYNSNYLTLSPPIVLTASDIALDSIYADFDIIDSTTGETVISKRDLRYVDHVYAIGTDAENHATHPEFQYLFTLDEALSFPVHARVRARYKSGTHIGEWHTNTQWETSVFQRIDTSGIDTKNYVHFERNASNTGLIITGPNWERSTRPIQVIEVLDAQYRAANKFNTSSSYTATAANFGFVGGAGPWYLGRNATTHPSSNSSGSRYTDSGIFASNTQYPSGNIFDTFASNIHPSTFYQERSSTFYTNKWCDLVSTAVAPKYCHDLVVNGESGFALPNAGAMVLIAFLSPIIDAYDPTLADYPSFALGYYTAGTSKNFMCTAGSSNGAWISTPSVTANQNLRFTFTLNSVANTTANGLIIPIKDRNDMYQNFF